MRQLDDVTFISNTQQQAVPPVVEDLQQQLERYRPSSPP
jgi:hypothetical protein